MPFCDKCGISLTSDDLFCPKCGNKINIKPVAEEPAAAVSVPRISKEESIDLANKLIPSYDALEQLKAEIQEKEAVFTAPLPTAPRHSAFKFFWPFIIVAFAAYVIATLIFFALNVFSETREAATYIGGFVGLVAAAAILAGGGAYAKSKRDKLNNIEAAKVYTLRQKNEVLKKETSELKTRCSALKKSISKDEAAIPVRHRNKASMEKALALVQSGRAENLYDALDILG